MIDNLQAALKAMSGYENTTWKVLLEIAKNSSKLTDAEKN